MTDAQYMLQSLKLQRALEQKYIPKVAADINAQFSQAADLIYSMTPQGLANNAALVIDKAPITKTVTALITEAGVRYAWLTGKDYGYGTKRVVEVKTRLWGFQFDEFMSAFVKNYLMQALQIYYCAYLNALSATRIGNPLESLTTLNLNVHLHFIQASTGAVLLSPG